MVALSRSSYLWGVDLTNGVRFVGLHLNSMDIIEVTNLPFPRVELKVRFYAHLSVDIDIDLFANGLPIRHLHVILAETLEVTTGGFVWDPTAFLPV